jgi:hypothetical protein
MSSYKTNSDRLGRYIADMRLKNARKNGKETVAESKTPAALPVQPQPVAAHQKPDWVSVLVAAVERDGSVTFDAGDLSTLLGLPAAKEHTAMLGILEPERQSLFTNGVRYFAYKDPRRGGHVIHFRMLALDSQKLF